MHYTGIGSRHTPHWCLKYFQLLGHKFAKKGWILRSGGCVGADVAFEAGCDCVGGPKEIYLPWKDYKKPYGIIPEFTNELYKIANAVFEPRIGRPLNTCRSTTKALMERNVCQVMGTSLCSPSNFLMCWTKGGTGAGGSGQAIDIAKMYNVPILDFGSYDENNLIQPTIDFFTKLKEDGCI